MKRFNWSEKVVDTLESYSGRIILAAVAITLLLVIPLMAMAPDDDASSDPGGDVFELQDDIDDRFESLIHSNGYIVEARGKDVLTQAVLWELYQNTQELLAADEGGELAPEDLPAQPYLYRAFDTDTNNPFVGLNTLADEVRRVLSGPAFGTTLELATDDQVKLAVHLLFSNPETSGLKDSLSVAARSENRDVGGREIDYWTSSALIFGVMADNEKLGGGSGGGISADESDLDKEEFNRNVQRVLRGDESTYQLWGIAIDPSLEGEDEGKTAGIFVMFTVIAALVVVGISLRSYWAMALTGAGLGALMIWLKGISNLVGLNGGLTIELIVPIAMIALGVDFAVHALRRYQEEKAIGNAPRRALRVGFAGVLGALVLAMLSDGIAFLSNASSGDRGDHPLRHRRCHRRGIILPGTRSHCPTGNNAHRPAPTPTPWLSYAGLTHHYPYERRRRGGSYRRKRFVSSGWPDYPRSGNSAGDHSWVLGDTGHDHGLAKPRPGTPGGLTHLPS